MSPIRVWIVYNWNDHVVEVFLHRFAAEEFCRANNYKKVVMHNVLDP